MKNKLSYFITIIASFFFIGISNVFAVNVPVSVEPETIPNDTYIIGTHVFDNERAYLSTQDIMWAARSINAESIDDMIIYYKDLNGNYVNGLTGEDITVPLSFDIQELNGETVRDVNFLSLYDNQQVKSYYQEISHYLNIPENTSGDYEVSLNANNFNDNEYDFSLICTNIEDENDTLNLGTLPNKVTVSNGMFSFPIDIEIPIVSAEYSCNLKLGNYTQELNINVGSEVEKDINYGVGYGSKNDLGNGSGMTQYISKNEYYLYQDKSTNEKITNIDIGSIYPINIDDGEYDLEISMIDQEGNDVTIKNKPTNINLQKCSGPGPCDIQYTNVQLFFDDDTLTVGNYEIEFTIKKQDNIIITKTINISILEYKENNLISLNNSANDEFDDLTNISFEINEKKEFVATFETELPDGIYNVKSHFELFGGVFPPNPGFTSSQKVEVKNGVYEYKFVIPKDSRKEKYSIDLLIYNGEITGVPVSNVYIQFEIK